MARADSPTEHESSKHGPTIQIREEQAMVDSPVASPTTTAATTPTKESKSPKSNSPSMQHGNSISMASSSSSVNQFYQQQQQNSRNSSGVDQPPPNRRRQGTHSHRNSSFEYKETLNATTRHLEDGSRIINQYKLYDMIGQGAYGNVYEACLLPDPSVKVAVKEFGKTRLRKVQRAANQRKPSGRGGARARGGLAARGAREGRESQGRQRGEEEVDRAEEKPDGLTEKVARMTMGDGKSDNKSGSDQSKGKEASADDPLSLIRHEIAILKKLDHPNVVELYEVLDDPTKDGLYMVFEHCPDGRVIDVKLHQQVEPLDEEIARDYFVQIMLGIEYLHHNDIVHRDIKPDNILLQDNRKTCKIVDFGVSEMFTKPGDDTLQKSAGSPAFMSPELCSAQHGDFHGRYSDIWSLGVTFYCMVVGRLPFDKSQFLELYEAINGEEPDYPSHLSDSCKDLLQRLMAKDSKDRITFAEMRKHPFITRQGKVAIKSEEENTSAVVVEVTDEEVDGAIKKIASVFTLARAISKFKRAGSRASSSGSLTEMAGQWASKGNDLANEAEGRGQQKEAKKNKDGEDEKEEELSYEHLAAAHIALGVRSTASAAKNVAKAVLGKEELTSSPGTVASSPKEDEGKEEKKKASPNSNTKEEEEGYFGAVGASQDNNGDTGKEQDKKANDEGPPDEAQANAKKAGGEKKDPTRIFQGPAVASPVTDAFPAPEGAGPAYDGKAD
ncbi:hypothetical protein CBS101457_004032 [Exobasidium rhododendri]|nr:hypothetical protein CBS101457_004032 [Exobasidium rhododendri]